MKIRAWLSDAPGHHSLAAELFFEDAENYYYWYSAAVGIEKASLELDVDDFTASYLEIEPKKASTRKTPKYIPYEPSPELWAAICAKLLENV